MAGILPSAGSKVREGSFDVAARSRLSSAPLSHPMVSDPPERKVAAVRRTLLLRCITLRPDRRPGLIARADDADDLISSDRNASLMR